ncbi:MAG: hypothetical protein KAU06_03665 [Candidatus Marinimicrobia bacterium]|nr:hypothetical protein [Candidatus Neomarinimicrobiota bacterium]
MAKEITNLMELKHYIIDDNPLIEINLGVSGTIIGYMDFRCKDPNMIGQTIKFQLNKGGTWRKYVIWDMETLINYTLWRSIRGKIRGAFINLYIKLKGEIKWLKTL